MTLDLRGVAVATNSRNCPPPGSISHWSTDSRNLEPGALFFALRGPRHDGHDHLAEVFGKGAAAAVVDRDVEAPGPLLRVEDGYSALKAAAAWARSQWPGQVVAVTGSTGKTGAKDAIAALLSAEMPVGCTQGNLNNHVGLPLSILRLPDAARVAVIEIGMNHAGEIRELAAIARPDVAVVTNVGYAHIEFFDSIEGIALAKRELIESLAPGGVAVLNADDPRVRAFAGIHPGRVITFGFGEHAQVRAREAQFSLQGGRFRVEGAGWFETSLPGRHGILNVLAALAVARVYGIAPDRLMEAARLLQPGPMRGRRLERHGILIIDDCYNSNPDAARMMLELLRDTPARRRIAVLGEMLELGRWSEPLHREIGGLAAGCGVSLLVGIRGAAKCMVDAAIEAGLDSRSACFFEDPAEAGRFVRRQAREGDAVLFKGSRGTRVEKALAEFLG